MPDFALPLANQLMELMSLEEKQLWKMMSEEDRYKNSSADFRLELFRKRQKRLAEMKSKYIHGEASHDAHHRLMDRLWSKLHEFM
jgi:hypothetical protein